MSTDLSTHQHQQARAALAQVLRDASGFELDALNANASFLELGFDSLFLIQLSQRLKRKYSVKIAFRQLIEDVSTIDLLIDYLAKNATFSESSLTSSSRTSSSRTSTSGNSNAQPSPSPTSLDTPTSDSSKQDNRHRPPAVNSVPVNSAPANSSLTKPNAGQRGRGTPEHAPPSQRIRADNQAVEQALSEQNQVGLPPFVSSTDLPMEGPAGAPPEFNEDFAPGRKALALSLPNSAAGSGLEHIISQQNALMARHLELLMAQGAHPAWVPSAQPTDSAASSVANLPPTSMPESGQAESSALLNDCSQEPCDLASSGQLGCRQESLNLESPAAASASSNPIGSTRQRFGPYKPVRQGENQGLTAQQQSHLNRFMERYTRRTQKSKQHAESHRRHFADPRGVAGYRRIWKNMVYQIAVDRSQGSKLWDIDGNEYIDIAMGFGLNLFGQSPTFITEALHSQLDRGVEVGPQSPLAGEVASLLCEFSRKDRVTFCNTGSEAVMAALRLARTVNGKSKTVFFNKDYHGNFDQVLLRSRTLGNRQLSTPAAPGVPDWYGENTIVLDYGSQESLRIIEEHADDIAAVLIEPVQSADPFNQPKEFLQEIRRITREQKIAMIMDEVITGFRAAQGGAQEWFDVWGDMATYGKVLGGGMPIGALAGTDEYMNALDGGNWSFADDSEPNADMTFFAGTFVRHPLAIASAYEVLKKVKEEGPELQEKLTQRTSHLTDSLNRFFEAELFPIRVAQFSSLFRFMFPSDLEYADMLYFQLLERGIFTRGWGDNCFLSTAHSDEDVERVIEAVQASCREIRQGGFFPEPDRPSSPSDKSTENFDATDDNQTANEEDRLTNGANQTSSSNSSSEIHASAAAQPVLRLKTDSHVDSQVLELGRSVNEDRLSTLIEIQEGNPSRTPLFCMPAADGLTLIYHELAECLGREQPVLGLNSPGVFKERIPDTLEELAERFIHDMRDVQPHGPYLIAGYCSGGTIAFEVAQQLLASGEPVALLACLESYNWLNAPSTNPTLTVSIGYNWQRWHFHLRNFLLLNAREKSRFLHAKFEALFRRISVWNSWAFRRIFGQLQDRSGMVNLSEIWCKHDQIAEAYVGRKYPGHLLQIRPKKDYQCHKSDELQADEVEYVKLNVYPAGMMVRPFVEQLANELRKRIEFALAESGQGTEPGRSVAS